MGRFLYNVKGILRYIAPKILFSKHKYLNNVEQRSDYEYIIDRVNYYNKLDSRVNIKSFDEKISIRDFKIPKRLVNYFYDSYEYLMYFDKELEFILESGDVNYNISYPAITKSRPIDSNNFNNVILNLDKVRHFAFIKDRIPFEQKDDILYFRGGVYQEHRIKFFDKYFYDSRCDLGHVGQGNSDYYKIISKPKSSKHEHLKHKFILSLEGNDVASNLKWIMNSNSLAIMPKPKFETWFMEGRLIADYHYIEINDDYSNVFEKIDYYKRNPHLAKQIIKNANSYCKEFMDKERETIISLLVLEKYFKFTN